MIPRGGNLGWNTTEGPTCFGKQPPCGQERFVKPLYSYGRDDGQSITGGLVYGGGQIQALKGRYVFGDFVSGRLWALTLSGPGTGKVHSLGRWPMNPSCFAIDPKGALLVADYQAGIVYRLTP